MKKPIRDGIAELGIELCRCADRVTSEAKEHAFKALDGDEKAATAARECKAMAAAYMIATEKVDDLRRALERNEFC